MNVSAIKKMEIINSLAHVPNDGLDKIKEYIKTVMPESSEAVLVKRSLKGIWKDRGFEKIADLENELKAARRELGNAVLGRRL